MDVRRGPYASSDSGGGLPRGILSPFLRDTSYAYATLTLRVKHSSVGATQGKVKVSQSSRTVDILWTVAPRY
jgi:hypothetical protein